jgi:multidrug efflux pump subunit AcrA (membrane-fusion protein)
MNENTPDKHSDSAVDQPLNTAQRPVIAPSDGKRATSEPAAVRERQSSADGDLAAPNPRDHSTANFSTIELKGFVERNRNSIIVAAVAAVAVLAVFLWLRGQRQEKAYAEAQQGDKKEEVDNEVALTPEAISAAGVEIVSVTERPGVALMKVTGTVEANQQQMQQVTPLVSGRVQRVYAALGDHVRAGAVLAIVASPQVAQLHAKLHETETHLALAELNLTRVQRAENRVAVLQAKAKLDEAEATLNRTRRLIELGAGAGKDLIAAETAYKTAKAEYDFQSNISLNKEVQEAGAEVETTRLDISHIKDELRAMGAPSDDDGSENSEHSRDTSLIAMRAPVSGSVSERLVNPGAGIEAGKPMFTIANLSTLWVIASVPEAQVIHLRVGTPAEVRSSALGSSGLSGRVTYIDPQLDEGTRTARVRIDVANPKDALRVGMFAQVGFQTGTTGSGAGEPELVVPSEAVQRIGDRTVVFMPKEGEPGRFLVRDVELGGEVEGYRRVLGGLVLGDRVVAKGSFTLKSRLMRSQLEEE